MIGLRSLIPIVFAVLFPGSPFAHAEEEKKVETEVAVQVAKVARATLHGTVTAYGNIQPEPLASARLAPAQPGIVAEVNAVAGQHVEKGAVLFRLDSRAADAAEEKAELSVSTAQANADRQKKLMAAEGTSEKLLLEARQALAAAKAELAAAKVQQSLLSGEAPFAGTVISINARPGEPADSTKSLAEIVDLDRLRASVRVPRAEASGLRVGQAAELVTGDPIAPIKTKVNFVSPDVDPTTDTILVWLSAPKGENVKLGEFVTARIFTVEHKDCLAVPAASVVKDPDDGTVIALVDGDKATRKPVKTGLREGDLVEIKGEGVAEGQTVVTVGAYGLPKETKVRVLK